MKEVFDKSVALLTFYRANKAIINLKEEEFKQWLEDNYFATRIDGKFVATQKAVEAGYMVNKKKAIIDIEELDCFLSYQGYVTPKGQEYILHIFQNLDEE